LWYADIQNLRILLESQGLEPNSSDGRKSLIWQHLSALHPDNRAEVHKYLDQLEAGASATARSVPPAIFSKDNSLPRAATPAHVTKPVLTSAEESLGWYESWLRGKPPPAPASAFIPPPPPVFPRRPPSAAPPSFGSRPPPPPPSRGSPYQSGMGPAPLPFQRPPSQAGHRSFPTPLPSVPPPEVPDYYAALELPLGAGDSAVRRAYRRLAMKHHPDKNPGCPAAEERFKAVKQAYEALADPQQRPAYDVALTRQMQWRQDNPQGREDTPHVPGPSQRSVDQAEPSVAHFPPRPFPPWANPSPVDGPSYAPASASRPQTAQTSTRPPTPSPMTWNLPPKPQTPAAMWRATSTAKASTPDARRLRPSPRPRPPFLVPTPRRRPILLTPPSPPLRVSGVPTSEAAPTLPHPAHRMGPRLRVPRGWHGPRRLPLWGPSGRSAASPWTLPCPGPPAACPPFTHPASQRRMSLPPLPAPSLARTPTPTQRMRSPAAPLSYTATLPGVPPSCGHYSHALGCPSLVPDRPSDLESSRKMPP